MSTIKVLVKKPTHKDYVFVKDKYIKQAERTGKRLQIVTPAGERICSAKDWMDGGRRVERQCGEFRPLVMWGNTIFPSRGGGQLNLF